MQISQKRFIPVQHHLGFFSYAGVVEGKETRRFAGMGEISGKKIRHTPGNFCNPLLGPAIRCQCTVITGKLQAQGSIRHQLYRLGRHHVVKRDSVGNIQIKGTDREGMFDQGIGCPFITDLSGKQLQQSIDDINFPQILPGDFINALLVSKQAIPDGRQVLKFFYRN